MAKNFGALLYKYTMLAILDPVFYKECMSKGAESIQKVRYGPWREQMVAEFGFKAEYVNKLISEGKLEIRFSSPFDDEGELPINLFDSRRLPFEV